MHTYIVKYTKMYNYRCLCTMRYLTVLQCFIAWVRSANTVVIRYMHRNMYVTLN